jgi:hypothetical protein
MLDAFRKTPLPIVLVILSFISPTELSLVVGDLRLSPHRVVFLLFIPFALYRLAMRSDCRLKLYDVPFFGLAIWQTFVFTWHAGSAGFAFGGSWALESLGAYLIARAYIRDIETLQATLRLIFVSIILAALIATLDTITGSYFVHETLRKMLGGDPMPAVEFRKGLARAASTFDHPIHYGTYCATMFALMWMSEPDRTWRYIRAAGMAIAALLAMSSAPLLSLGMQLAMMGWNKSTARIPLRTQMTLAIAVGLYLGVLMTAQRPPVQILISIATFDPWTGFYRMMIWEYGLENLWTSPWIGIGMADWVRPKWMYSTTIDAYWLVLALRSGIPALLLLVTGIFLIGYGVVKRGRRSSDLLRRRMSAGWMISLIAICLLGATVHYWNVPHALLYFFLGLGSALADPRRVTSATSIMSVSVRRQHPSFIRPERPLTLPGSALPT